MVCIAKEFNIAYKMDENDLNVHIQLYLGYGVTNKMSMSLAMGISLNPFEVSFLQSTLIIPVVFELFASSRVWPFGLNK